ncbi:MAG: alanine racemase [Bdellovibrionales bacterium]|nr:alanine racemase [Bdellovibrionales bacterium]
MKTVDPMHLRSSVVTIDSAKLAKNWNLTKSLLPTTSRILPMVKANAYGHGDILIANVVSKLGAVGVGVADLGEAVSLRDRSFKGEILCMGPLSGECVEFGIDQDVILNIRSLEELKIMQDLQSRTSRPFRFHIKIDSGMNRWGFRSNEWEKAANEINKLSCGIPEGIYTHLCESNNPDQTFTKEQIKRFSHAVTIFEKILKKRLIRHCANSGGILHHPESHFDWVRPGVAMYGYPTLNGKELDYKPILKWKAQLFQVQQIEPGDTVGYNRTFRASRKMTLGVVGVGYGDGYQRGYASANIDYRGHHLKIVGIICMDALMVDLTNVPKPMVGEEVTLIGSESDSPTAWDLAHLTQTIPYEVLTRIQSRVPRVLQ